MNTRDFLTAGLLLCIFSLISQAPARSLQSAPAPAGSFVSYLPYTPVGPHLDATLTAVGEDIGYPTRYFACGFLNNATGQVMVDSQVALLVYIQGYLEPEYYPSVISVNPAFSATLPGQPNPFMYSLLLGKATARIDGLLGTSAHPSTGEPDFHELSIDQYACDGTRLHGTARNDDSWILTDLQVAALDTQRCLSGATSIQPNFLPPGGLADFEIEFYSPCDDQNLLVVGQGTSFP